MLNGVVQPVTDANERCIQTLQPYQSLWLAHWKRASCDAAGDTTTSPNNSRSKGHIAREDGLAKGVETSSRSANGVGLIKKRTFEIGSNFMKIGRKRVGNDRMISYLDGRDADALSRLNPSKESLLESSSHVLPDEFDNETGKFDKGKAAVSLGSRQRSADMGMLEHDQCCETDVHCERKVGPPSQSDNSSDECLRESVSCDHCLSMINRARFLKMQKCSGIRLSPSQSNSSEENETTKSHIDCYSKLKLQKCGYGLGTMGICTGVDVPGGASAGFPRFSQTDNDLLITKKTGVNTCKENDVFRSKRIISKINGNLSGAHSLLPFFGQNKQKVQLQSLNSLNDSKVKEYTRDVKASKVTIRNESSAETGIMDMDSFREKKYKKNLHSASNSTASTKAFDMESNEIVSSRKVEQRRLNNKLPDINLERPALPGSPQNTCPSSSKTLTMETNKLLEHVKQPKSKSNFSLDESPNADAGNRWVKRLKFSSSNSSSPSYASITPREGTNKLFNGIPRSSTTRSKSDPRKRHDERHRSIASDKSEDFSKIDEEDCFTENPNKKAKELLLSHAWIQRWLHSRGRETKRGSEIQIICDPKLASRLENEQRFPSIAAMALMAKVLTCFQQCELQKKGSYTVWNTKTV